MPQHLHFLEDIVREVSSLRDPCTNSHLTPSGLRRLILLLSRGHWSAGVNHGPEMAGSLGCLQWNPDKRIRNLDVELQGTKGAKEAGDTAIFVRVGNFRFKKLTFGGRSAVSEDNATVTHSYPTTLQVVLQHEAPTLDLAYDMGWSSLSFFSGYGEAISEMLGQDASIEPNLLADPQMTQDDPDSRFRVDFGMTLQVYLAVETTVESHRLTSAFDTVTPLLL